jgi:transcriptional regulator with XRE-family HTH domain
MAHAMKKTTKATAARNVTGRRIRQARLKCSPAVSQEDLAGRLANQNITMDRSAISRIESGTRYLMDYEVAAIARSLKVPVAWLFGEADPGH